MKKVSKAVAMILVVLMLSAGFTGCITIRLSEVGYFEFLSNIMSFGGADMGNLGLGGLILLPFVAVGLGLMLAPIAIDIATLPIQIPIFIVEGKRKTVIDTTDTFGVTVSDFSAKHTAVYYASIEKLSSLSEAQCIILADAFSAVPEDQFAVLIEKIESLSEPELLFLLRGFNSLTEDEIDSIIKSLSLLAGTQDAILPKRRAA